MNAGVLGYPGGEALLPSGIIVMWAGFLRDIPKGWRLCDGTNGTPNLLNRFVKGVANGSTNPGATGGAATHNYTPEGVVDAPVFTGDALAGHAHGAGSLTTAAAGDHDHTYSATTGAPSASVSVQAGVADTDVATDAHIHSVSGSTSTAGTHSHTISGSTSSDSAGTPSGTVSAPGFTGTPAVIPTEPPYYALAFIQKT